MPHITTRDNITLRTKVWGTSGRPVVLIHGWPLSADTWDEIAIPLADAGFRTIAYDRRGFGGSDQPWGGYDYDSLADDLQDVMHSHRAEDATLVGFSMGGGEVARYMSRHQGQNVRSAALIASIVPYMLKTPDNPDGVPAATFDEMTVGMQDDRAAFFASFFDDFYGVNSVSSPVSSELLQWTRSLAMQASLKATLACAESFATTDFRADLPQIQVPTLIIHGTNDQIVPIDATARQTAKAIVNSTLLEYEGAPHGLLVTHRQRLIEDLLTFLQQ